MGLIQATTPSTSDHIARTGNTLCYVAANWYKDAKQNTHQWDIWPLMHLNGGQQIHRFIVKRKYVYYLVIVKETAMKCVVLN